MGKKTLVIGASPNPERFSYKAVELLGGYGHSVVPLGIKDEKIGEHRIVVGKPHFDDIHTVSLYINAERQPEYFDYIFSLKPQRIIFNPGTENEELIEKALKNNIEVVEDCTLVMLRDGLF